MCNPHCRFSYLACNRVYQNARKEPFDSCSPDGCVRNSGFYLEMCGRIADSRSLNPCLPILLLPRYMARPEGHCDSEDGSLEYIEDVNECEKAAFGHAKLWGARVATRSGEKDLGIDFTNKALRYEASAYSPHGCGYGRPNTTHARARRAHACTCRPTHSPTLAPRLF